MTLSAGWGLGLVLNQYATSTFPIMHLICLPKILHNLCFSFLFCIIAIPRELENNAYAKFSGRGSGGWADEVHYGKCGSGSVEDEKFLKYLTFFRATLSILLPCLGHYLVLKPYIGIPKEQIHIIVIAFVYLE